MTAPTPQLLAAEQIYFRHKNTGIVGNPRPMLAEVLALGAKWRTIESAPIDTAEEILVYGGTFTAPGYGDMPHDFVSVARWSEGEWQGAYQGDDEWDAHKPTHWMPLPLPPASGEGE